MTLLGQRLETRPLAPARGRLLGALPGSSLVLDSVIVACAIVLATLGRRAIGVFVSPVDLSAKLEVVGPLMFAIWVGAIWASGGYHPNVFGGGTDEYRRVVNASFMAAGLIGVGCYLLRFPLSRGFFVLAFAIGIPALCIGRFAFRRALHRARRYGHLLQPTLLVGTGSHVDEVAAVLAREPWQGFSVVGTLTPATEVDTRTPLGLSVLGNTDEVAEVAQEIGATVIVLAGGAVRSSSQMRQLAWDLEHRDIQVIVAPSVTEVSGERVRMRPVGGLPLMHVDPPRALDASSWAKRLFDVLLSSVLVVLLSPLLLAIAIAIKAADGGPILFRQTRTGRDGAEFSCLKFRTMVVDAEAHLPALHAQIGHDEGLFKMQDDPRVTRPGRWLRRFSLDELPQLVNVLRGDMSLVGPRPPLPSEVARYNDATRRRLHVRPGMTGLWQVSGRSDLSWSEAIRLDLYYVDNWSMVRDLAILARTVVAVVSARGAY